MGKETSREKGSTSKQSQRRNLTRKNIQKCFEPIRMIALLDEVALLSYNAFVACTLPDSRIMMRESAVNKIVVAVFTMLSSVPINLLLNSVPP